MKDFAKFILSPNAQLTWMRENPGKYVLLNVAVAGVFVAATEIQDRRWQKRFDKNRETLRSL